MHFGVQNSALRQAAVIAGVILWRYVARPEHPDLFPLTVRDAVGFSLAAGALLVAAGGGIGGGALLVPIYLIILGTGEPRVGRCSVGLRARVHTFFD